MWEVENNIVKGWKKTVTWQSGTSVTERCKTTLTRDLKGRPGSGLLFLPARISQNPVPGPQPNCACGLETSTCVSRENHLNMLALSLSQAATLKSSTSLHLEDTDLGGYGSNDSVNEEAL